MTSALCHATRRDAVAEAAAALRSRPRRSVLSCFATAVAATAVVATAGIVATASNQVSARFDAVRATQVSVEDTAPNRDSEPFPEEGVRALRKVPGVRHAGRLRLVARNAELSTTAGAPTAATVLASVYGAEPDALAAALVRVRRGRMFDAGHELRGDQVALVGENLAVTLGIVDPVVPDRLIFVAGRSFNVVGIIVESGRVPQLMRSIVVPRSTASTLAGAEAGADGVLIDTVPGAAQQVGVQAPLALLPEDPARLSAASPPDPRRLRVSIEQDVQLLGYAAGGVALVLGMLSIGNATYVSVLERRGEIGLRRAVGARRGDIRRQILVESSLLALFGGGVGLLCGSAFTVAVALLKGWVAIEPAWCVLVPLLAAMAGAGAGWRPAQVAAAVAPAEALRAQD